MVYIILLLVLLIVLLITAIVLLKKQSENKKLLKFFQNEYLRILRIDALDRAILRQFMQSGPRKILVKIHQQSELTDKTFVLDMDNYWDIGRKSGEHTICIRGDKTVSALHCRLVVQNERLTLIDQGSKNLTYYQPGKGKYKKKAWHLPQKGSQILTTGDRFYVGYTTFSVTVFDSSYGIV